MLWSVSFNSSEQCCISGSPKTLWVIISHYCSLAKLFISLHPCGNSSFIYVTLVIYYVVPFMWPRMRDFLEHSALVHQRASSVSWSPFDTVCNLAGQLIAGYWYQHYDLPLQLIRFLSHFNMWDCALPIKKWHLSHSAEPSLMGSGIRMVICVGAGRGTDHVFVYK